MSRFSGKCDLYDWINIGSTNFSNLQIYIGKDKKPLEINYVTDLIPYYPRIVSVGYHSNVKDEDVLFITDQSYVDIREQEHLTCLSNSIKEIYKFCRKNHRLFLVDDVVEKYHYYDIESEKTIREICNRVEKDGFNATIDGIHLMIYDLYRQELYKEMVDSGAYTKEEAEQWVWKKKIES